MNLSAMICAAALLYMVGWLGTRGGQPGYLFGCLASLLAFLMIMSRGYYWTIFERGEGFFTANRISAICLLLVVWVVGVVRGGITYHRHYLAAAEMLQGKGGG